MSRANIASLRPQTSTRTLLRDVQRQAWVDVVAAGLEAMEQRHSTTLMINLSGYCDFSSAVNQSSNMFPWVTDKNRVAMQTVEAIEMSLIGNYVYNLNKHLEQQSIPKQHLKQAIDKFDIEYFYGISFMLSNLQWAKGAGQVSKLKLITCTIFAADNHPAGLMISSKMKIWYEHPQIALAVRLEVNTGKVTCLNWDPAQSKFCYTDGQNQTRGVGSTANDAFWHRHLAAGQIVVNPTDILAQHTKK